ncbi:MAG: hypothetical protein WCY82_10045 [Desulfotomaculaceae bacterium]
MESNAITIRKAIPADAQAIWHLLRCENKVWDVPEGSGYAFLAYGLLGVICRLPKAEVEQRMKSHLKLGHPKQNIGFGIR